MNEALKLVASEVSRMDVTYFIRVGMQRRSPPVCGGADLAILSVTAYLAIVILGTPVRGISVMVI